MQVGKPSPPRKQKHRDLTDAFYLSAQWRKLVEYVWRRDNYQCQQCQRNGVFKPLKKPSPDVTHRGYVDHITQRKTGGQDTPDNLELLCKPCHDRKSRKELLPKITGRILISIIGNIASGKTTVAKELALLIDAPYLEINNLKKISSDYVVLESSGLGPRLGAIKKGFNTVYTFKLTAPIEVTRQRLAERERSGYVYPSNNKTPEQFYHHVQADLSRVDSIQEFDTTQVTQRQIVDSIRYFINK